MLPLVAIISPSQELRSMLLKALADEEFTLLLYDRSAGAHELIARIQPDLVLLDLWLYEPDSDRQLLELLEHDQATRTIPVVVLTVDPVILNTVAPIMQARGHRMLAFPFTARTVVQIVREALA
jgi:DNA-binding NtrC family response regulator